MLGMVIVNYNDFINTEKLLKVVKKYKCLDKIIVVDNKSTDESLEKLKMYDSEKIKVVSNSNNNGYASALNLGAKTLIKELGKCNILFSNSDIIIGDENGLKELSGIISNDIKVVGPTIVENGKLNRGWRLPTIKDEIRANIPLLSRAYNKNTLYNDNHYNSSITIVDVVSGCFFMVESEALKDVGFFDENTFLYYEENILAYKMKEKKYKEAISNDIVVVHNHSKTIDKNIDKMKKYNILKDSQEYFVTKYLKATEKDLKKLRRYRKIYTILKK